jgi:large subunit ribosomal protein L25
MERLQLSATPREVASSRHANRMRKAGRIPAVVYGKTQEPVTVSVSRQELIKMLNARKGEHGLLDLKVGGEGAAKAWEKPVLIKHLQRDPVSSEIVHVDFHAITLTEHVRVKVSVVLQGEPIGVKQDGGLLEHFLREIEIDCLPTQIPKHLELDISQLKIGSTVHVSDLTPPEGARITTDAGSVIASVQAPKVEKPEEAVEGAVTEPEVIREKKPEAEAEGGEAKAEKPEKAEKKEEKK